jgi:predicted transcriptional regulator
MGNRVVTSHISEALARKLDGLADRLDRPRGWVVKEALEAYLALDEERHRATKIALAEVDAGKAVDHSEVLAWANDLTARPRRRASKR